MIGSLINTPVLPECKTSIVIPVRNEAETLPQTLAALTSQINAKREVIDSRTFEIIVLANNCTDDSAEVIRKFQSKNPAFKIHLAEISLCAEDANIGFVRRLLMNEAHRRLSENNSNGVIMTTDADTQVAPDWIFANLCEIKSGAEAVGGRIIIAPDELEKMDAQSCKIHLEDDEYRMLAAEAEALIDYLPHDSAFRHHQHFNGSFAVTVRAFEKSGGVPNVKFLEDVAFYDALQRIDARFRHSRRVKVYTSSRHEGRSEVGLSYQINEWKKMSARGEHFFVESVRTIAEKFDSRRQLREIWRQAQRGIKISGKSILQLAEKLHIPESFLRAELEINQTFGKLYENILYEQRLIGEWQKCNPLMPLNTVLEELRHAVLQKRIKAKEFKL